MRMRALQEVAMGVGAAFVASCWRITVIVFGVPIWLLMSPYFLFRRMGPVLTLEQWIGWGEDGIARAVGLDEYPRYPSMTQVAQRNLDRTPGSPRGRRPRS